MSAQTQWFYDPEMLPGGPKCPDCRSTESPRLVTFDGIDSGTGEQIHEERFRCSCGFQGETEEFEGSQHDRSMLGERNSPAREERGGWMHTASASSAGQRPKAVDPGSSPGGSTSSPRIERGTEDGSSCPF